MKKLITVLIITAAAGNTCAQSAKEMANEFLQHYTELADGSYRQANKTKLTAATGFVQYDVAAIAGADQTVLDANPDGLEFQLTINRNNKKCVKWGKEVVKAMEIIGRNKGYQCNIINEDLVILNKGAEEIMTYHHELFVDIYPTEYAHFKISAPTPYSMYMANESGYGSGLPITATKTKEPQVIEIKDKERKSSLVLNGLFENKKLTAGAMRLSGYGDLFDGTWLSRSWHYDSGSVVIICFVPAGTTDSITGYMSGFDVSTFALDPRFYDGVKFNSGSPMWVLNTFAPYYLARKDKAQKEYEAKELQRNSVSSEEMDRMEERRAREDAKRDEERCLYCGGTGQITTGKFFWGKEIYKTCPRCHGTGKIE